MANVFHLSSVVFVFTTLWKSCQSQTRLSLSAPLNPVQEGAVCALHCQIWNLEKGQTVEMYRTYETHNTRLSVGDILADTESPWFLAIRQLGDGSVVYFLSLTDISRRESGNYSCKVFSTWPTITEEASQTISIDVMYSPRDSDPVCSPDFDTTPVVYEGVETTINCSSELGNPVVDLQWSKAGFDRHLQSTTSIVDGRVHSVLKFRPSMKDDGVVLLCQIKNRYTVEAARSCHVGPFTILPNPDRPPIDDQQATTDATSSKLIPLTSRPDDSNSKRPISEQDCLSNCSALTPPVIYWILATVITSFIALLFLLIAATLFFKLCQMPAGDNLDYAVPMRKPTAEELYVEVDCKRDDRQMYMALHRSDPRRLVQPEMMMK